MHALHANHMTAGTRVCFIVLTNVAVFMKTSTTVPTCVFVYLLELSKMFPQTRKKEGKH